MGIRGRNGGSTPVEQEKGGGPAARVEGGGGMGEVPRQYWAVSAEALLQALESGPQGLAGAAAAARQAALGKNVLAPRRRHPAFRLFLHQFTSPIVLILLAAAGLSFLVQDPANAAIILAIVLVSGLLGFWQEKGASEAMERLLARVEVTARVRRDGAVVAVPVEDVVPGDVVELSAGAAVPADCRLLEARALFVDEAVLTGESMPVEKRAGTVAADAALHQRSNVLFMGTHVVSGTGVAVAVVTGRHTEYGAIAGALAWRPPETEFERGVRRFGYLLMEITFLLVICIFAINVYLHRPILDSFLFALALAVGLTPQLLPAIISVNLAQGARRMAEQKVIVKRLAAIENFGSMNVLCSDKTGTLTRGTVDLQASIDACGNRSEKLLYLAYLNAVFQSGYRNPIDEAISSQLHLDTAGAVKLDEVPYDFVRKRLSVLVQVGNRPLMIT
ncbi:MAG: HAD-IC family P-type ATPase, partial [Syntrophomonadaceae bacterium]|nr:HAD-IC family P-type ATPase [Syntrophomonadaceae bacterium]